ncbi:hypothetical protein RRF57_008310 [Xylaria bambusicola]|uniref:Uncharacterized protein n=1 Tax=Xylaria bambusicola TaxID=326684 RepID=A0AAN7UTQ9_9PEZI
MWWMRCIDAAKSGDRRESPEGGQDSRGSWKRERRHESPQLDRHRLTACHAELNSTHPTARNRSAAAAYRPVDGVMQQLVMSVS